MASSLFKNQQMNMPVNQATFNQLASNKNNLALVMNLIQQSGGDPKAAFYKLAQQKGINPEQFLSMLR